MWEDFLDLVLHHSFGADEDVAHDVSHCHDDMFPAAKVHCKRASFLASGPLDNKDVNGDRDIVETHHGFSVDENVTHATSRGSSYHGFHLQASWLPAATLRCKGTSFLALNPLDHKSATVGRKGTAFLALTLGDKNDSNGDPEIECHDKCKPPIGKMCQPCNPNAPPIPMEFAVITSRRPHCDGKELRSERECNPYLTTAKLPDNYKKGTGSRANAPCKGQKNGIHDICAPATEP